MGDARGHWEGNTLVVETTNFDPRTAYQNGSPKLTLVERFRPVASDKIEWSVTLNDPDTWAKPWTFAMTLTEDPGAAAVRIRLPRGQLRDAQHPERRARRRGTSREVAQPRQSLAPRGGLY